MFPNLHVSHEFDPMLRLQPVYFLALSINSNAFTFRSLHHIKRSAIALSLGSRNIQTMSSFPNKIQTTLDPCVALMNNLSSKYTKQWKDRGGIYNLAQGIVYWSPPDVCNDAMAKAIADPSANLHLYGPDEGLAELTGALKKKVYEQNGLEDQYIMITAGANQAYTNCVLTLLDNTIDKAVVFAPYYFNHVMALQMTIGNDQIVVGDTKSNGEPDLDWLEATLKLDDSIRMVTVTNPNNPTGTSLSRSLCQRLVKLTKEYDCWLILDCTYEAFTTDGPFDSCFNQEDHCIHIFSFSKAYALAGYRCGYLTLPNEQTFNAMMKVQDTIPIAPSRISQVAALAALQDAGPEWVREKVDTLHVGRQAILEAMDCLPQTMGGNGAMYIMGKLPVSNDVEFAERLIRDYGVAVIPGSFCGFSGWIRVCYANLPPDKCKEAAKRLAQGLAAITDESTK